MVRSASPDEMRSLGWRYIAFQNVNNGADQASIPVLPFLKYLQSKSLITGAEYLSSVEFGNEIVNGQGETRVNAFSVTLQ